jgi:hypothetical protein
MAFLLNAPNGNATWQYNNNNSNNNNTNNNNNRRNVVAGTTATASNTSSNAPIHRNHNTNTNNNNNTNATSSRSQPQQLIHDVEFDWSELDAVEKSAINKRTQQQEKQQHRHHQQHQHQQHLAVPQPHSSSAPFVDDFDYIDDQDLINIDAHSNVASATTLPAPPAKVARVDHPAAAEADAQVAQLRSYVASLEAQLSDSSALRARLAHDLNVARTDAAALRRDLDSHSDHRRDLERARSVVQHTELELKQVNDTVVDLHARLDAANADRAALQTRLADSEKRAVKLAEAQQRLRASAAAPPPPPPPPPQPPSQVPDAPTFNLHERLAVESRFGDTLRKLRVDCANELALLCRPPPPQQPHFAPDAAAAARAELGAVFAMCESGTAPLRRLLPPLETVLRSQRGTDHSPSVAALTVLDTLVNMDADCLRVVCARPRSATGAASTLDAVLRGAQLAPIAPNNPRLLAPRTTSTGAAGQHKSALKTTSAATTRAVSPPLLAECAGAALLGAGDDTNDNNDNDDDDVTCDYLVYVVLNFKDMLVKQSPLVPPAVRFMHSVAWRADTTTLPCFRTLLQSCALQFMFTPRNDGSGQKRVTASVETQWLLLRLVRLLLLRQPEWHDALQRPDSDTKRYLLDCVVMQLDSASASTPIEWFASAVRGECAALLDAVQTAADGASGCILNDPTIGTTLRRTPFEVVLQYTNFLLRKIDAYRSRPDHATMLDDLIAQARALLRVLQSVEASTTPSPTSQLLSAIRDRARSLRQVLQRDSASTIAAVSTTIPAAAAMNPQPGGQQGQQQQQQQTNARQSSSSSRKRK